MIITKRNGTEVPFDINKIDNAITKAALEVDESHRLSSDDIHYIAQQIQKRCNTLDRAVNVEEIQDMVEEKLIQYNAAEIARKYIKYRYKHELIRKANTTDATILSLIENVNEEVKQENANKNPTINSTQRDYMAGEVSKDISRRILLPKDVVEAHDSGKIHFHDMDYFSQHMHNCCLINLEDMLQNGTVISGTLIEKPHSFSTACNITTQIVAQVASNQYGGQSISLTHLAPFVDISRKKLRKEVVIEVDEGIKNGELSLEKDSEQYNHFVDRTTERRVREEVKRGVQMIQYQVITLMTTNGQAPFVTVFMYLNEAKDEQTKADLAMIIEEVIKQRYEGVKNEKGVWITPAFPKLIYVLEPDNVTADSKYWYLTELAAKCTARRLVPDYISEKKMLEYKINAVGGGDVYACMGCRSFLTPDRMIGTNVGNIAKAKNYDPNKPKYYGRFNQGVVTINLPHVALSAHGDIDKFWEILEDRCELCHRALQERHKRLLGTVSDVAPILWQYGALARLDKGEKIDKLLFDGYSTISLGYAGLWECVYALCHQDLTEPEGKELGLKIMQKLNDFTAKWKKAENIDYSIYGTPMESTTYKFAKALQRDFGIIEGVSDRNFITNSYHVHVEKEINAFDKLALEAQFQKLSPGGAISYVETPNLQDNTDAVIEVMQFIYDNIMYAELNTKSDYCQVCGYDGEIQIVEDENHKLFWECPNCGNRDFNKMNVARRVCGYIGTNEVNQGRLQEYEKRVLHLT
jgi:ribonucleoside-triphosphate reductase